MTALEQIASGKKAGNRREDAEANVKRTGRALLTPGQS